MRKPDWGGFSFTVNDQCACINAKKRLTNRNLLGKDLGYVLRRG